MASADAGAWIPPEAGAAAGAAPFDDAAADARASPGARERQRQSIRRLWRLFWALARPFWRFAPGARRNLAWVVVLGVLQSAIAVLFSYVSRDFWTALQKKDVAMFWRQIVVFSALLAVALPVIVWYSYEKDRLALRWRRWHTRKLLGEYFAERNYYCVDQQSDVDNVDQRIAEDTAAFTGTSLSLFMSVFMSVIDLLNFSVILMTIYPRLFVVLFGYAGLGTVVTVLLGRRLISLNFAQLKREADFRFSIIRVRENAESIAFYSGESREQAEISRRFDLAVDNLVELIRWSRNLAFFTTTYSYVIQILPLTIIAPMYFKGSIELGVVSQSQQAFRHILDDLSLIISQFESLSAFSAGIDRLGELEEFLYARYRDNVRARAAALGPIVAEDDVADEFTPDDLANLDPDAGGAAAARFVRSTIYAEDAERAKRDDLQAREGVELLEAEARPPSAIETVVYSGGGGGGGDGDGGGGDGSDGDGAGRPVIDVAALTLTTPDAQRRVLFEDVTLTLARGQRMLISGPSGAGKSSFLRALAGLWTSGSGRITRPSFKDLFFLPQRPYCTLGTLREQLVYPRKLADATETDDELCDALARVDLAKLPRRQGGLDAVRAWSSVLSLGEQQRLAFARLLLGRPALAILDESTSALDLASEEKLYSELQRSETAYISVGHRPSLKSFHDVLLRIEAPEAGGASVIPIAPDLALDQLNM